MDSSHYSESRYPTERDLGSHQPHATGFDFGMHRSFDQYLRSLTHQYTPADYPPDMLPVRSAGAYDPIGIFPVGDKWAQLPTGHGLLTHGPPGIPAIQPQHVSPSYADKAIQSTHLDASNECKAKISQEEPKTNQPPITRRLAPQEIYKPTRQPINFKSTNTIEFRVGGEEGIRLSDALEGNWVDFEGRDDRSLFEGDRPQVIIRLQLVGCSPWHSKIPTTDFTAKRRPITRMRLATEVAKSMRKFIAREKLNGHNGGHPRCDWGGVSLEDVFLIRMVRVSVASWQPEIFVERPSVATRAV